MTKFLPCLLYLLLSIVIPHNLYSQTVNLEIVADNDCYEPGDVVTLVFVTRMYIPNTTGCENTSTASAQARDLTYGMNFLMPDGTFYSQSGSQGATSTVDGNITFTYIDTDVLNNVTGAVNPSLDACDDIDVSCASTGSCPSGYDPSTSIESDWVHAAIFTIPASMTSGNLTLQAGEDFNFWYNSDPSGGAPWINTGSGSEGDTIIIPVRTSCILNTEISDLQVKKSLNNVSVSWVAQDEETTLKYQIERSLDGKQFEVIGQQSPINLNGSNSYEFWDKRPIEGTQYYRIAIFDIDGTIAYSNTLSIEFEQLLEPVLYPNPFSDIIYIKELDAFTASNQTMISIYDLKGQLLIKTRLNEDNTVNLNALNSGTFILKATSPNYTFSKKIQKMN